MPESHDTTLELWKPIPLTNGLYEASSLGRIRSVPMIAKGGYAGARRVGGRILKPGVNDRTGYLHVGVRRELGKPFTCSIHKLVCDAFLGPANGMEVNHKNGNKHDNRPENLEYVTRSQNIRHSFAMGGRRISRRGSEMKLTDDQVREIRRRYASGSTTKSRLANEFGVGVGHICWLMDLNHRPSASP